MNHDHTGTATASMTAGGRKTRVAAISIGVTIVGCLLAVVYVRPRVSHWLEVRAADQDLANPDVERDTRADALRRLQQLGEQTEHRLTTLLYHSAPDVRDFAAYALSHRPKRANIIAFLVAIESNQHVAEIGKHAPRLFYRYARNTTGALTEIDRRVIVALKTELASTDTERSGAAAWALTAFVKRDPLLSAPLATYLPTAGSFHRYIVLREMATDDPAMREQYVDQLLAGLGSVVVSDQLNAKHGLANFIDQDDLKTRLQERLEKSTDPNVIATIDEALNVMASDKSRQP